MSDPISDRFPPADFWTGIDQFNQGEFYACHDTLEAIWMEALETDKPFFQGILQMAVALYHWQNGNVRGATILMGEGINRLGKYLPDYGEIDVAQLIEDGRRILMQLQQAQVEAATEVTFDLPMIQRTNHPQGD
jgi:uncharacterized protein